MNRLTRAEFLRTASLMTLGAIFLPRKLFSQDSSPVLMIRKEAAKAEIVTHALRGNVHMLEGSGGNIAVFHGKDGMVMVDSGIAVSKQKIQSALAGIGDQPLKFLINSHWHFDHSEGNEWINEQGATIIGHRKTKENLASTITVRDWNYTFPPAPKKALPTITFDDQYKFQFNGSEVQLRYYNPCHTNSDISVYFPEADILHVGDTWWNSHYPFIDHDSGGSIDGMIEASNRNLTLANDKTLIIPGHGGVGKINELVKFRDMLVVVRERIAKLKKEGRSMEETVSAKPTQDYDALYGNFVLNGAFFTRLVYADV